MFNSQRPKWVNPSEFLDASFQNLFELSFFHEQGSLIPSGWSGVQDGSLLPKLESRKPAPSTPTDQDMASPATWGNGTASEEDSSVEEASHTSATTVTRMNDESSEEDVEFPPFQVCPDIVYSVMVHKLTKIGHPRALWARTKTKRKRRKEDETPAAQS